LLVEVIPRVESVESLVADKSGYETETRLVSFTHWQRKPHPVLPTCFKQVSTAERL